MTEESGPQVGVSRPLEGVRVVEFGHVAAGPFGSMLLADLGADVVKIESPSGDQMRNWSPLEKGVNGEEFSHNFASVNRNKRSVVANLKDPSERQKVQRLCESSDVILENYRPGVLSKFGLGFEDLACDGKPFIYCSISGYGQT